MNEELYIQNFRVIEPILGSIRLASTPCGYLVNFINISL